MSMEHARSFCQILETDHALWGAVNDPAAGGPVDRHARAVELGGARGLEFTAEELTQAMGGDREAHGVAGGRSARRELNLSRKEFPKSVLKSSVWPAPEW